MCFDLGRGRLLVEPCLLGVKTTSDEVEYQFLLGHRGEKIKKEDCIYACATSSEVVSLFIHSLLPIFHLSEVFFLDPTPNFGEMCPNRSIEVQATS